MKTNEINRLEVERKTWDEFRSAHLIWWVNRALHLFGWAIVVELKEGKVVDAYPAQVTYRGFDTKSEAEGFTGLTRYLNNHSSKLLDDVEK